MDSNKVVFTDMEIDAIGEILNISLGSSATSVSNMLNKRVDITTPKVKVASMQEFQFKPFEPAIAVEINYIEGLDGINIMILKENDVKAIVGLLLGIEYTDDEPFEMDEMAVSAICEVMNQMMGASSTALSEFLCRPVNISPPLSYPITDTSVFKEKYFANNDTLISTYFNLIIEDTVNSEFISVMSISLAKELVSMFGIDETVSSIDDLQLQLAQQSTKSSPKMQVQKEEHKPPQTQQVQQQTQPQMQVQQQNYQQPKQQTQPPKVNYDVKQATFKQFEDEKVSLSEEQSNNLSLIMSVPLQITVEIGRTKKKIKEILEFSTGSIIELNKQAGSQVDIFANGKVVAKGDVVVIDDYYGVKITEVMSNSELFKLL